MRVVKSEGKEKRKEEREGGKGLREKKKERKIIIIFFVTSFAACCMRISFSCSIACASSAYASAHDMPTSITLVLTTHSVLPPSHRPARSQRCPAVSDPASAARCRGGTMSRSARTRSSSDSLPTPASSPP